jgi:basic amino acid/polyamine antiporter, APA family
VTAVCFVLSYLSAYVGIFVLRVREPNAPRPFRAWGFPFTTGLALLGSLAFLVVGIIEDPRSGKFAAIPLAIAAPFCWWASRRKTRLGVDR